MIPAEVEEEKTEEMRRIARKIFRAVDGSGLARVDFFIDKKTGRVLFNELNTMPGFTPISMYPMLWVAGRHDRNRTDGTASSSLRSSAIRASEDEEKEEMDTSTNRCI